MNLLAIKRAAMLGAMAAVGTMAVGRALAQLDMGAQQQNTGANQSIAAALMSPVTGAAYQAEKVTKSVQTLGDGTRITHETKGLIARDAAGRVREDLAIVHTGQTNGQEHDVDLQTATVGDPVAHSMLIWTGDQGKVAMKMDLPALPAKVEVVPTPPGPPGSTPASAGRPSSEAMPNPLLSGPAAGPKDTVKTEDLGRQSLEGVLVTGTRVTTTIPTGKLGNDRPIVVVHEEWRSPELKILVKTEDKDPRTGDVTMMLEGLTRTDPDEALFKVPAGYTVQDMADMFKALGSSGRPATQAKWPGAGAH